MKKIFGYAVAHKAVSVLVALAVFWGGYLAYGKLTSTAGETRYVLGKATKGTLIVSVSASGQVEAVSQVDIKSKASSDVVWVGPGAGTAVVRGEALVRLDDTDARKAVSDAALDLAEARLQLDRDTAQAPIDYARKTESLQSTKDDLVKEYADAFTTVSGAFLDLPAVVTGAEDVLFGKDIEPTASQWNIDIYKNLYDLDDGALVTAFANIAEKGYRAMRPVYDANLEHFKSITRESGVAVTEQLLGDTLDTAELVAQTVRDETNLLDAIVDIADRKSRKPHAFITTSRTNLKSYLNTVNGSVSALLARQQSLTNAKQAVTNVERDISILRVNNPTGVDPIALQIARNSIGKKESALADVRDKLADFTIRAPYDGVVAKSALKTGDSVSSGAVVAIIVAPGREAVISLNEIDAAKVRVGQKATLTFDAVEGLALTGVVAEVDTVGTLSQGVVTYGVRVRFDAQDDRVKPGMSVDAAIITDSKIDALMVPNSAVKSRGDAHYVQILDVAGAVIGGQGIPSRVPLREQAVTIGLANDTNTEIVSGLREGDAVVVSTIAGAASAATAQSPAIRIPGLPGGGGRTGGGR